MKVVPSLGGVGDDSAREKDRAMLFVHTAHVVPVVGWGSRGENSKSNRVGHLENVEKHSDQGHTEERSEVPLQG